MSTIIAGLFETGPQAAAAKERLRQVGVREGDLCEIRNTGTRIAVNASSSEVNTGTIARVLMESGAVEVERAEGSWAYGIWADFDPLRPPLRLDSPPPVPSSPVPPGP